MERSQLVRKNRRRVIENAAGAATQQHRWLLVEEVAEIARAPLASVREWIADGRLPSSRPGRRRLVRADVLEAFLNGEQPARAAR